MDFKNQMSCLSIFVIASISIIGSAEHATAAERELPIERLWALEQRTDDLEQSVTEIDGKMQLLLVAIERVEKAVNKERPIVVNSEAVGHEVATIQDLVKPMSSDIDALKDELQKLHLRVAAIGQRDKRIANKNDPQIDKKIRPARNINSMGQGGIDGHTQSDSSARKHSMADNKSDQSEGLTHWLTESSGVRHNSHCKWHRTSKGRPAKPDEGRACTHCGG